jgi:outer membrane protein TolC
MKPVHWKAMLSAAFLVPNLAITADLTLEQYLNQVREKNQAVIASTMIVEGTASRQDEGRLIFRPSIFAQGQMAVDKKHVANQATQGNRVDNEFVTAGLMQQFDFGMKGQLSYSVIHTKIYNAGANFVPLADYNDGVARIELSQSLWRNFWGKESKAQSDLIDSQSKAVGHLENFRIKSTLASAENVYWNLSQMKKIVKVQTDNLSRSQKLSQWNQRRINSGLAERSDFLQAEANYKLREYELKNALLEKSSLERTFNSLRGIEGGIVTESLTSIESKELKALPLPVKAEFRDDTKAALEQQKLAKANADLAIERNKPTFEVYGSYAFNGRDPERAEAISDSFKTDHSTSAVGVRFNAPLDFGTTSKNIDGYKKEQIAAEYTYQKKVFDQEREWTDLVARFEDAKTRLSLVEKIADAQKVKITNENNRLSNGRTTTFQVLNFEQDYASAELLKIQSETNLLNIYSQLKIFSAGGSQ